MRKRDIEQCHADVKDAFDSVGLSVNPDKTAILDPLSISTSTFKVLGCDLANSNSFWEAQQAKQQKYFSCLRDLALHPQLKITLLRLCGAPRIRYLLSVSPPSESHRLASWFDSTTLDVLAHTLHTSPDQIPSDLVHDAMGAGIPKYDNLREKLFHAYKDLAINGVSPVVELVTRSSPNTALHSRNNLDASWLWFDNQMTSAEFIAAFSVRLNFLPQHLRVHPCKCDCGAVIRDDQEQISHTFRCNVFTRINHTTRHNMLRDEICRVANSFGITTSKEPTIYHYQAGKKRPDILFHTSTPLVTDVTIVQPTERPGDASAIADDEKTKTHADAAKALGHTFIPGACETYGLIGSNLTKLVQTISNDLPPQFRYAFRLTMTRSIATAMARGRASGIFGTRWRQDDPLR